MPSSKHRPTATSDEIAAMLAGHAARCSECKSIILVSNRPFKCPYCIIFSLQERLRNEHDKVMEVRKRLAQTKWPEWPKNAKTRWETDTTLTTGDTT